MLCVVMDKGCGSTPEHRAISLNRNSDIWGVMEFCQTIFEPTDLLILQFGIPQSGTLQMGDAGIPASRIADRISGFTGLPDDAAIC
jgi:hypothetical protein